MKMKKDVYEMTELFWLQIHQSLCLQRAPFLIQHYKDLLQIGPFHPHQMMMTQETER